MQALGLGTPGQNQMQQSQNMTNAINAAFGNNQQAVRSSLAALFDFLSKNQAPVAGWGNVAAPQQFSGQIGGGKTDALGNLVTGPQYYTPGPPQVYKKTGPEHPIAPPGVLPPPPPQNIGGGDGAGMGHFGHLGPGARRLIAMQ
ncbi:MAG: hypothetical protein KGL39_44825 [Patescibacteria group bacterium]|nr:hypothetical protein [Patescibacteria group bacterium]